MKHNRVLQAVISLARHSTDGILVLSHLHECIFMNAKAGALLNSSQETLPEGIADTLSGHAEDHFSFHVIDSNHNAQYLEVHTTEIEENDTVYRIYTLHPQMVPGAFGSFLASGKVEVDKRYQRVFERLDEIFLILSEDFTIHETSRPLRKDISPKADSFVGACFLDFVFPDDQQTVTDIVRHWDTEDECDVILRVQGLGETLEWMRCRFIDKSMIEGKRYYSVIVQDITSTKQTERELALSEVRYQTIFDSSATALVLYDLDKKILLVNKEMQKITGASIEELMYQGKSWLDYVAEHDRQRLTLYHERRRKDPLSVPSTYEFQIVRKDGELRDVLITAALIPGAQQGVGSIIDITESKQLAVMYQTIVEQSLFGIIVVRGTEILFANTYVQEMVEESGSGTNSVTGESILHLIHPDDVHTVYERLEAFAHNNTQEKTATIKMLFGDGKARSIECYFNAIEYYGKKAVLILGIDVSEKVQVVKRLQESEERYKIISEVISDYAYSHKRQPDGSWKTDWISDTILRLYESTRKITLFSWADHVLEQDRHIVEAHLDTVFSGKSNVAEFRIAGNDGKVFWIREYCRSVFDSDGKTILKIYSVGQDITERRQMRQALFEFERRFRVMLENLSMISIILDVRGKMVFCNDYLLKLTGYSRDDVLSIDWFDTFLPPEQRDDLHRMYQAIISEQKMVPNHENEILARGGERRLIRWTNTILRDTKGKIIGTASIGEDITDQRIAEKKLRNSEERYRQLFTIEPDALIVHALLSQKILEVNDVAVTMCGYSREELLTMRMSELSAEPERTTAAIESMSVNRRLKVPHRYYRKKDGTVFAVEISAGVFTHEGEDFVYVAMRDISDRVKAERELVEAKERAELSDKMKDSFITNMSHEIRTPLNIILGYTGLLESEIEDMLNEEQRDYFASVDRAGKRLQRTVEQLLNLSSLQVGSFPVNMETFDVCQQVDHLVYDMISLAYAKEIALEVVHEHSPIEVRADKYLLEQAIANILDNAIKFTEEGGVFVHVRLGEEYAKVVVTDTGIGISDDYLPRIFAMFSQEVLGYTRPFDGLGLGLALTKMYLDEIGGRIHIDSQKHEGTSIVLEFPLAEMQAGAVVHSGAMNRAATCIENRMTVLLIEDDTLSQKYLNVALQGRYNLLYATSAEEALAILATEHIDIIFLDLYLRGTYDGLHTAKTIKFNSQIAHIPIIVLANQEKPEDRQRCMEAGCCDFILKPARREEIQEAIKRLNIS